MITVSEASSRLRALHSSWWLAVIEKRFHQAESLSLEIRELSKELVQATQLELQRDTASKNRRYQNP